MKRYTKIEIAFALLGLAFVLIGLYVMIFPDGASFYSPGSPESSYLMKHHAPDAQIHAPMSRIYVFATIAIIVGCGMTFLALFPWKARKKDILEE